LKRYETIFITRVNQAEEQLREQIKKFEDIVVREKGVLLQTDRWGQRKLAYDIDKQSLGYYVLLNWAGPAVAVAELERNLKIDDRVLKFQTVKTNNRITEEEIKAELAAKEAKSSEPTETAPAAVAEPPAGEAAAPDAVTSQDAQPQDSQPQAGEEAP
jgi:small subunit ribosomal protein S6